LQDQIIYQIHFPESDRIIGCREQELIPIASRGWPELQYGDSVTCQMALSVNGDVVVTRASGDALRLPIGVSPATATPSILAAAGSESRHRPSPLQRREKSERMATFWPAAAGAQPLEQRSGNIDAADTPAFEQAWQRQCQMEQTIVARVPEGDVPPALLENIAASLPSGSTKEFTPPERAAIVLHHARLEIAFADIARQAPQPDLATVQAWYLRHQTQFMRPEQRLTRHLLLTVDNDREAVHQQILGLYRQINASRDAFARWPAAIPTVRARWKTGV
jgi:hypothetical protein